MFLLKEYRGPGSTDRPKNCNFHENFHIMFMQKTHRITNFQNASENLLNFYLRGNLEKISANLDTN